MRRHLSTLAWAFLLSLGLAGAATHGASADTPSDLNPPGASIGQEWPSHWEGAQRYHGRPHYAPPPRHHGPRYHRPHRNSGFGFYFSDPGPSYVPPYYGPPRYQRPRVRGISAAHVQWCQQRYRSYRAYDNTFQPYNGPRRQCRSPYG